MSLLIEYCSPLKSFQHSVSLFISTITIGEGKVKEEKRFYSARKRWVEGGCMFPLPWRVYVPFAMAKPKTDFRIFLRYQVVSRKYFHLAFINHLWETKWMNAKGAFITLTTTMLVHYTAMLILKLMSRMWLWLSKGLHS